MAEEVLGLAAVGWMDSADADDDDDDDDAADVEEVDGWGVDFLVFLGFLFLGFVLFGGAI